MNHLKIMQSLGGDIQWSDRFFARHASIVYYWALNVLFFFRYRCLLSHECPADDVVSAFRPSASRLLPKSATSRSTMTPSMLSDTPPLQNHLTATRRATCLPSPLATSSAAPLCALQR